jgi:hypothetical protein
VSKQKFNAKAPGHPRTAKTACTHSHCRTFLATISHPNRQPVLNLESWRSFFASSRLGVAALVVHPIALREIARCLAARAGHPHNRRNGMAWTAIV